MKTTAMLLASLTLLLGAGPARTQETKPMTPAIEVGSDVSLEYTLSDDEGRVLDSNKGRVPLTFTQGAHQIVPGLEHALNGMRAGEEKKVTVQPADGYGDVDPAAVTEVPKDALPPDAVTVGTQLVARSRDGQTRLVRVKAIKEATVIIDLNHPLAGKILHFDVKVLLVEPPKR